MGRHPWPLGNCNYSIRLRSPGWPLWHSPQCVQPRPPVIASIPASHVNSPLTKSSPPKKTLHTVRRMRAGILHVVLPPALTHFVNGLLTVLSAGLRANIGDLILPMPERSMVSSPSIIARQSDGLP